MRRYIFVVWELEKVCEESVAYLMLIDRSIMNRLDFLASQVLRRFAFLPFSRSMGIAWVCLHVCYKTIGSDCFSLIKLDEYTKENNTIKYHIAS